MSEQVNAAYETLRDKILSGEFRPAQRLTEAQITKELGISRSHVRAAFQRLVFDGLIDLHPNQGAAVSDITLEDILDIFVSREALELEAYRRAFTRIDDVGIGKLDTILNKMRQAIADDDFELYSSSATAFREAILDFADSLRLKALADSLLLMSSRVVLRKIMIPLRGKSSLAEHENIMSGLKGNHIKDLESAFRSHIAKLKADIEQHWDIVKP